jgi:hypothetical protein
MKGRYQYHPRPGASGCGITLLYICAPSGNHATW